MGIYKLQTEQLLDTGLEEVWDFISSPKNLQRITPKGMGFKITSGELPAKMYPGMMISYKVKPLGGIPITWVTEITQVKEHEYFVDEQRMGPYSIWHHEHHLISTENGVLMKDTVTYKPPLGFIGDLMVILFIRKKLSSIFDYRRSVLNELFNSK